MLQNNRIIEFVRRENRYNIYGFCFDSDESTSYEKDTPDAEFPEYSQEISDLIPKLQSSGNSLKDKRLDAKHQIAYLLEKGHAKRNGGRVAVKPHIDPVEENGADMLESLIKKELS